MASLSAKATCLRLAILLLLGHNATSFIVPEEIPTVLSLIYSNIPPIRKGTDSRVGVGFRLGEHADFQVLVEIGPQKETEPLGTDGDTKRKRAAMLSAAMRGELGPWAQAVAKYQMEQKLKQIIEKYKLSADQIPAQQEKSKATTDDKSKGNAWLSQWSQSLKYPSDSTVEEISRPKVLPNINRMRVVSSPTKSDSEKNNAQSDLKTLETLFANNTNETNTA